MTLMECPPLKAQRTLSFGDYLAKLVWLVLRSVGSQQICCYSAALDRDRFAADLVDPARARGLH